MVFIRLFLLSFLSVFLGCFSVAGFSVQAKTVDGTVAVVNSEVITLYELDQAMHMGAKKISQIKNPMARKQAFQNLKKLALNSLIEQKLLQGEMARRKISVTDNEVDFAVQNMMRSKNYTNLNQLKKALSKDGLKYEQFRKQLRKQLEQIKFVRKALGHKTKITDADVDNFIAQSGISGQVFSKVKMSQILLELSGSSTQADAQRLVAQAKDIYQNAKSLKKFKALGKKYGSDSNLLKVKSYDTKELNKQLAAAISQTQAGSVSRPVQTQFGINLIFVVDRSGSSKIDRKLIKSQLKEQILQFKIQSELKKYLQKLKDKAIIQIML